MSDATATAAAVVQKDSKMRQLAAAIGTTRALMGPVRKAVEDCPPDPSAERARRPLRVGRPFRREPVVARR